MKKKTLDKAGKAYLVQNHQMGKANEAAHRIKSRTDQLKNQNKQNQDDLDDMLAIMEKELLKRGLDPADVSKVSVSEEVDKATRLSPEELAAIRVSRPAAVKLETVEFTGDWDDYYGKIDDYIAKYDLNLEVDPLIQLLPADQANALLNNYKAQFGNVKWQKWDYGVVGLAALLAILTDIFIVRIPKDMMWKGKSYKGSPVTKFMNQQSEQIMNPGQNANSFHKWMNQAQNKMEAYAKVPYDVPVNRADSGLSGTLSGLSPKTHRLQTLGHDPILGFVFGVFDIMTGSMTGFGKDASFSRLTNTNFSSTANLIQAFVIQAAHILSDIFTKQGIAPPFFSMLQAIDAKSSFRLPMGSGKGMGEPVSYNHLSRYMYTHGYDMRHFGTMSLVPLIVEIVIRTYYKLVYFETLFPARDTYKPSKDVKLQGMLTFAHTATMAGNVVKMWINGWNPLAFNWAEMLALVKTAFTFVKAQAERDKKINQYLTGEWERISANCIAYNF